MPLTIDSYNGLVLGREPSSLLWMSFLARLQTHNQLSGVGSSQDE